MLLFRVIGGNVKKVLLVLLPMIFMATGSVYGALYRLPYQSVNSTATAGAYLAHTDGADASYFNPANMAWLPDKGLVEADLSIRGQSSSVKYEDGRVAEDNIMGKEQGAFLPSLFIVSKDFRHFRAGVSLAQSASYSQQWQGSSVTSFASELSIDTLELDTSVSYRVSQYLSIALVTRFLSSEASMKSNDPDGTRSGGVANSSDIDGDDLSFGYSLTASAKPFEHTIVALIYQSKVDLNFDGDAVLSSELSSGRKVDYNGGASFAAHLPAVLAVACSQVFFERFRVEFKFERVFWSEFESLDVDFSSSVASIFGEPVSLNLEDTKNYRLAVEFAFSDELIFMAGLAMEQSPVPDETLGFILFDSDSRLLSTGLRYSLNENFDLSAAYLYKVMEKRTVASDQANGTFSESSSHVASVNLSYIF